MERITKTLKKRKLFLLLFPIIVITFLLLQFLHEHNPQFYLLEYKVREIAREKKSVVESAILVNDVYHTKKKMLNSAEYYYWTQINLDTLLPYPYYHMTFYRETKYLTRNFKVGNEYEPVYSHWDNTMDWRNHYEDEVCGISIFVWPDCSGYYRCTIYNLGFFERFIYKKNYEFINKTDCKVIVRFKNIKDFYIKKCNELGIKKNDMDNYDCQERGIDGHKKVKGRKEEFVTDTLGLPIGI